MRDGLLAVQQTATVVMERAVSPRDRKLGNISDFRRLQPATFAGTEKLLNAE